MTSPIQVALIDDDAAVRDSLQLYLRRKLIKTTCFQSAEEFLNVDEGWAQFDCVVSDVRMPGMSGVDLMRRLTGRGATRPVILITGHGDIDMAVSAIKAGAFDFIEKPFDESRLLASIRCAIDARCQQQQDAGDLEEMQARFELLSIRQRQVMELAAAGLSNKEIGSKLKISHKTVENHRAWVMERIGARNVADLVRIAMQIRPQVRTNFRGL